MTRIRVPHFLALPENPTVAGVVVIHEGNGMSQQLLRFCERLAAEGYAVAAPDLFFRTGGPAAKEDYREQFGAITTPQMIEDLATAAAALHQAGAERIGVMGFCMGGRYTWQAALHSDGFAAAAGFYGGGIASELGRPRCPTMLFFGAEDAYIPREDIDKVAAHHQETFVYPGAGHGFMRDGTEDYVPEAATDAWAKTLEHFRRYLMAGG
jgi:carboxymethylenebutenolidase